MDSREGVLKSLQYALGQVNGVVPPVEELHWFLGPPLRQNLKQLLPDADAEMIERAVAVYRRRYAEEGIYETMLYPSVVRTLDDLKKAGFHIFVATSKTRIYAEPVLKHCGIDHYFSGIYGAELDGKFDDKKDLIAHLIIREGIQPAYSIMIGDRRHDIDAAKVNGMRSVGVLYGYGDRKELEEAGADRILNGLEELLPILQ